MLLKLRKIPSRSIARSVAALFLAIVGIALAGCETTNQATSTPPDTRPYAESIAPVLYPYNLRNEGIEGRVVVEFMLTAEGKVTDLKAISASHPDFIPFALEAIRKSTFIPATQAGKPIDTRMRLPIDFHPGTPPESEPTEGS